MQRTITSKTSKEKGTHFDIFKLKKLMDRQYEIAQKLIRAADADNGTSKLEGQLQDCQNKIADMLIATVESRYITFN